MTRAALLQLIKGKKIEDLLETDIWRDDEPLVIAGFTTEDGYTVYLRSIPGSESVTISMNHPAYEAEKATFLVRLENTSADGFLDFRAIYLSIDEIRELAEEQRKKNGAGGVGASVIWNDTVRVRFSD